MCGQSNTIDILKELRKKEKVKKKSSNYILGYDGKEEEEGPTRDEASN